MFVEADEIPHDMEQYQLSNHDIKLLLLGAAFVLYADTFSKDILLLLMCMYGRTGVCTYFIVLRLYWSGSF